MSARIRAFPQGPGRWQPADDAPCCRLPIGGFLSGEKIFLEVQIGSLEKHSRRREFSKNPFRELVFPGIGCVLITQAAIPGVLGERLKRSIPDVEHRGSHGSHRL